MTTPSSSSVWESYIRCQLSHRASAEEHRRYRPFVTLSRQTGAKGGSIGRELVEFLRERDDQAQCPWTLFDRDLIARVLREHHLTEDFEAYMPENKVHQTQDIIEELFGLHPPFWSLIRKISETIIHLAQMGNVVLTGRGANVITRGFLPAGFHVRLIGSLPVRAKRLENKYGLTRQEALSLIKREDEGRKNYLKQNFGKDIDNPLLYDAVINTDCISSFEAAEAIGTEVLHRQARERARAAPQASEVMAF